MKLSEMATIIGKKSHNKTLHSLAKEKGQPERQKHSKIIGIVYSTILKKKKKKRNNYYTTTTNIGKTEWGAEISFSLGVIRHPKTPPAFLSEN